MNFFAVVEYPKVWPHGDKWLDSIEPGEATAAFKGWHPAVIEMVSQHLPVRWGLFGRLVDRLAFRPFFQAETERSFRRLAARWFPEGASPVLGASGRKPARF